MDKPSTRYRGKSKKGAQCVKPKSPKKKKTEGPTCSMFLSELSRKLAAKKREAEEKAMPKNIVQSIIESLTNALPVKFSRKSPPKSQSPLKIETLQNLAPELLPNDVLNIPPPPIVTIVDNESPEDKSHEDTMSVETTPPTKFKMPKMPLIDSDIIKMAAQERKARKESMKDESVNTGPEHDVASEITKHVNTLKKISLIAEEFNQKTARNLKEIVNSVQEDLMKKLEDVQRQTEERILQKRQYLEVENEK